MRILGARIFLSLLAGKMKNLKPSLIREKAEQKHLSQSKQSINYNW